MTAPTTTGAVGSCLRGLREERGASLDDIAQATRLSVRQLAALEADDFAELPAPVFVKGFIRAYCHFLGVTPDEALARYRDVLGEPPASARTAPSARPTPSWGASPIAISLLLLLAFGGGLLVLNLASRRGQAPTPPAVAPVAKMDPAAPPAPAPVEARRPAPAAVVSPPVTAPSSPARPGMQRLSAKAIEPTWLRVQIDDGQTVEELLPVGATREWTASRRFILTVGNAGGLELSLNGRPMPSLGSPGAVIRGLELPQATAPSGS